MKHSPNHALKRTRRERRGCNPRVPCAGSLSWVVRRRSADGTKTKPKQVRWLDVGHPGSGIDLLRAGGYAFQCWGWTRPLRRFDSDRLRGNIEFLIEMSYRKK